MGRLLQHAVQFSSAMPFVNPSRAPLSVVCLQGGRFVSSETPVQNAVFLTTGIITECSLLSSAESWSPVVGVPGASVQRIRLRPFSAEYDRAAAFFGNLLNTNKSDDYGGPFYDGGLTFVTRKEGANKRPSFLLPSLAFLIFKIAAASMSSSSQLLASSPTAGHSRPPAVRAQKHGKIDPQVILYPQSLSFDDESRLQFGCVHDTFTLTYPVPIYDARKENHFTFRFHDLRDIVKLPRFKNGKKDPAPEKYAATVGYTVGTFVYSGSNSRISGCPAITMNVMFVIILGRSTKLQQ
jgi:hypothetical protein